MFDRRSDILHLKRYRVKHFGEGRKMLEEVMIRIKYKLRQTRILNSDMSYDQGCRVKSDSKMIENYLFCHLKDHFGDVEDGLGGRGLLGGDDFAFDILDLSLVVGWVGEGTVHFCLAQLET